MFFVYLESKAKKIFKDNFVEIENKYMCALKIIVFTLNDKDIDLKSIEDFDMINILYESFLKMSYRIYGSRCFFLKPEIIVNPDEQEFIIKLPMIQKEVIQRLDKLNG